VVLAAAGYPERPRSGDRIAGLDDAIGNGALVFHAGTVSAPDGGFLTRGGRVLSVVGQGADLSAARAAAERAVDSISFAGRQRRRDIAAELPEPAAGDQSGHPAVWAR
jgi:phosphoribosylamine--glycine ligase